ncbi:MAG: tetratricopeptide repeat protein [Paracoccaceae bacterium]
MFKKAFRRTFFWAAIILLFVVAIKQVSGRTQLALEAYRSGNIEKAARLWEKMARNGDARAQFNLGVLNLAGKASNASDSEAYKWMLKSARNGNAKAQYEVGKMYESGRGTSKSNATAVAWIKKSADQGYGPAETDLGLRYLSGSGVEQSAELAEFWLSRVIGENRKTGILAPGATPCGSAISAGS